MHTSSVVASKAGSVGAMRRRRPPGHPDLVAAEQDLAEAQLEQHIKQVVDGLPPLRPEQRSRLAALLADDAAVPAGVA